MKVGIITFHRAHNYGAVLQCYALVNTLKKLGCEVEVIDYLPKQFVMEYSLYPYKLLTGKQRITQLLKLLCVLDIKLKRRKGFNDFIEGLPLSSKKYDDNHLPEKPYDYIFFGSDQIWNPTLTNNQDKVFCGNFEKKGAKFISYAASTSPKVLSSEYETYFRCIIDRFDKISTRERSLTDYLNEIKPLSSKVVLDPVLLLTKDVWSKIVVKPRETKYLLIYTVPQHPQIREIANRLANERNLCILEIRPTVITSRKKGLLQTISPQEFLGYIMYADYVVTTSFHGTALSVIFGKQFITLSVNKNVDDRALNLLSRIGLENRLVNASNPFVDDYEESEVEYLLNNERNQSISYITESINQEND